MLAPNLAPSWHHLAGSAIKRAREACGLTQEEVAIRARVAQSMVSRVERGRSVQVGSFLRLVSTLETLSASIELPRELREWLTDCANVWTVPGEGASS